MQADRMREIWKRIPFPPRYSASNLGRIRSDKHGRTEKIMTAQTDKEGYLRVYLHHKDKVVPRFVHRLVLEAWRGQCPEGLETRHLNGIRNDNRLRNLKWGSHAENRTDRSRHSDPRSPRSRQKDLGRLSKSNQQLRKENDELRAENERLQGEVVRMKEALAEAESVMWMAKSYAEENAAKGGVELRDYWGVEKRILALKKGEGSGE